MNVNLSPPFWCVLCLIWFVYPCPFLALSPFVSSVNCLWCCGGLVFSSVALQLAILIGFLFYSEVVKAAHRPSQAALDILIGKQQRKVFTLQIHEGYYKIKLRSVSLSGSLIRGRHKEWTCCSSNRHCAVNSSFGRVESDKGPKAELREEAAWPHDCHCKSKFLSFSWTSAHLKSQCEGSR